MTEIQQRVARGCAVLDRDRPDWHLRVRPEDIEHISRTPCAISTVYGPNNYANATMRLAEITDNDWIDFCWDHAFICTAPEDPKFVAEWRRVIAERRAGVTPEPAITMLERIGSALVSVVLAVFA